MPNLSDEMPIEDLEAVIENLHGGVPRWVEAVRVTEVVHGQTIWDGAVQVFDVDGSRSAATRCYAWSHAIAGSENRRVVAILHLQGVESPRDAVRAAIVAEQQRRE